MSHQTDFEHARIRLKRAIDLIHRLDVIERQLPPVRCLAFLRDLQPATTEYVEKLRQFRPDVWEWIQGQSHSDPALAVLVAITELPQPEARDAWQWIVGQSHGDADLAVPVAATPLPQVKKPSVVSQGTGVMLLSAESAQTGDRADDLLLAMDKIDAWLIDHANAQQSEATETVAEKSPAPRHRNQFVRVDE